MKAVYLDDYDQAGAAVADNSVAARYVAHQRAFYEVDDLNGTTSTPSEADLEITTDLATKSVTAQTRGDESTARVWRDFVFQDGKITSWQVKGQSDLASRLWTTRSTDKSEGVSAELVSAYQANDRSLNVVVKLSSSSTNVRVVEASYTPDDGYKHDDNALLLPDVDKGGKALTYFSFNKAAVGGKLKLTVDEIDANDNSSSTSLTTLTLQVH